MKDFSSPGSEKKTYRKCEKAGCPAEHPECFSNAVERFELLINFRCDFWFVQAFVVKPIDFNCDYLFCEFYSCCGNGYTSRWYHLSDGEHFCNECFDHYYRRCACRKSFYYWQTT